MLSNVLPTFSINHNKTVTKAHFNIMIDWDWYIFNQLTEISLEYISALLMNNLMERFTPNC